MRQRVKALQALAAEMAAGRLELHPAAPLAPTLDALRALPGVGEWTAQYIAMRGLGEPDAFPHGDLVLRQALGNGSGAVSAAALAQAAEAWRPWRAYAAVHLWAGMTRRRDPKRTRRSTR